ncbi:MAG TPA: DUF3800 domain-containing protein [Thermoclostridium caenicola]|uniref:DUF3800 domain-containing protein n=1 Tax=Thermoclostridium caenicola TaxID=659425 RepID=UPI002CB027FB|nr:DUF3800 domain-containing protein [Thermoclostridium caenicola]HOK42792.1 DUF3800 domain-containing protein [Thermoclostridium caenicola]HPO77255.1 DUF3800 domain-containing protein [Thermoclostridium caenicola]
MSKSKSKINISDFDYIMFVDASGDDGYKFKERNEGSSICYTVACLLMKQEDIMYNYDILKKLKSLISSKEEQEIKYTTIRRHKKCNEIYRGLSDLKATIYTMNAFKKEITDEDCKNTELKFLSSMCHYFPINIAGREFRNKDEVSLLIVIDRMKYIEMENVSNFIEDCFCRDDNGNCEYNNYELIFRDSKDQKFLGLQLADWIAGMFRHFSEELYQDSYIWRTCPLCLSMKKKLCHYYRKKQVPIYCLPIKPILKLCNTDESGKRLFNSYIAYPIEHTKHGFILDCLKL